MDKSLKNALIIVGAIFVCLLLYTKIFGPIPFSVTSITTNKTNLFTVQGTGEATGIPDTAMVTLGVNKEASTVQTAQNQVNEIINNITADLKGMGVKAENIKTSNYSVNPNYDYSTGRQVAKGYTVNATIEVKLDSIDKANQAVDLATKNGATQVGNVQFVLDEKKQKALQDEARKEAIKEAKERAQSLANAAGIRLGRIVDVQENPTANAPQPLYQTAIAEKAADAAPPTELNPGENKVSVTISLSYETY
jgi:uncharacterized protein